MQPLDEIVNTDIVFGTQAHMRYMTIFYAANSAISAAWLALVFDTHTSHKDIKLGALLANFHNILVVLIETVAKTFVNRACVDCYEQAFLRFADLSPSTRSRQERSPRYRKAMLHAW